MAPMARSAVLIGFDSLCREKHLNPHNLMREVGLDPLLLRTPDVPLSYARFADLLTLAAAESGCPGFGRELSRHHDYLVLGPVGLLLSQAQSFSQVLELAQRYVHLHAQGIVLEARLGSQPLVEYRLELPCRDLRQLLELGLAVLQRAMSSLFGEAWQPQALSLRHGPLGAIVDYAAFFPCPVRFHAPVDAVHASTEVFGLRPAEQRGRLTQHLLEQYERPEPAPVPLVDQVKKVLLSILPTGEARLEVVARLLGCHPRSLQKRLQQQGESFRALLDEVRLREAQLQLELSDRSVGELAFALGYTDESAFSRAFRRLSGVSPRQWRQRMNAERLRARSPITGKTTPRLIG